MVIGFTVCLLINPITGGEYAVNGGELAITRWGNSDFNKSTLDLNQDDKPPDILNIPLETNFLKDPDDYDPYKGYNSRRHLIFGVVYNTLVTYDPINKEIQPNLAKDWFVSNDSKHWTFILRDDVLFHDGSKFTAYNVKFTLGRLFDPNNPAYFDVNEVERTLFEEHAKNFDSITVNSLYSVTINLKQSFSPFLSTLIACYILSPNAFEDGELVDVIGTGPYVMTVSTTPSIRNNLTRNENYFEGVPPFKNIILHSEDNIVDKYIGGEIDTFESDLSEGFFLSDDYDDELYKSDLHLQTNYGSINLCRQHLSNYKVRQALNLAINRSQWLTKFDAIKRPGLFFDGAQYLKEDIKLWEYDPERANEILDDLGLFRDENGTRFNLEILILAGTFLEEQDYLNLFSDIGVTTTIISNSDQSDSMDYDIYFAGWTSNRALDPGEWIGFFDTEENIEECQISNSTIDDLHKLGISTPVRQEKEYYYNYAVELIQDQAPLIDLFAVANSYYFKPHVSEYVSISYNHRYIFNYASNTELDLLNSDNKNQINLKYQEYYNITSSFEISNHSIYFRKQDLVIGTHNRSKLEVTAAIYQDNPIPGISRTSDLSEIFKYFKISVSNQTTQYNVKLYHDLQGEPNVFLFKWEDEKGWLRQNYSNSDHELNYIEVSDSGDSIYALSLNSNISISDEKEESISQNNSRLIILLMLFISIPLFTIGYIMQSSRSDAIKNKIVAKYRYVQLFFPSKHFLAKVITGYILVISGITISYLFIIQSGGI
jgi:peptide/nickel transport system substrate-binding protein